MNPKCPNHNEILTDIEMQGGGKGRGTCPVSEVYFDFHADTASKKVQDDKNGSPVPAIIVEDNGQETS